MFARLRRKRRSAQVKQELGQSVDHFRRAATIAAHETSATVGPKISAAKERAKPVAVKARDTASTGWESALATLTPLVAATAENTQRAGKKAGKGSRRVAKANMKDARKLQQRAEKALRRAAARRKGSRLVRIAVVGVAVGAGAAFVLRRRRAAQWDEYEPNAPIATAAPTEDAAFEPDTMIDPDPAEHRG